MDVLARNKTLETPDSWYCPEFNEEGSYSSLEQLWDCALNNQLQPGECVDVTPFHDLETVVVIGIPTTLNTAGWPTELTPVAFATTEIAENAYDQALANLKEARSDQ